MKLCDSCGFVNWEVTQNKKKQRICAQCNRVVDFTVKCAVEACHNEQKELLPQSDERDNYLNYG